MDDASVFILSFIGSDNCHHVCSSIVSRTCPPDPKVHIRWDHEFNRRAYGSNILPDSIVYVIVTVILHLDIVLDRYRSYQFLPFIILYYKSNKSSPG